jgi:hypothetical protein
MQITSLICGFVILTQELGLEFDSKHFEILNIFKKIFGFRV